MTAAAAELRRAILKDIPAMLGLINDYAARQVMLPRTEFELAENIRDFVVAYSGDELVGCGALHFYTPTSGEVRSLAVSAIVRMMKPPTMPSGSSCVSLSRRISRSASSSMRCEIPMCGFSWEETAGR